MGGLRISEVVITAPTAAASIGTTRLVVAVISMMRTIPVSGARTMAANKVDMPTMAKALTSVPGPARKCPRTPWATAPHRAPTASNGEKRPPGVCPA
jgi:hypothetical protein